MVRLCGAALGFLAFTITVGLGMAAEIPHDVVIFRAITAMFIFFLLGLFTGWIANRVIDEHALAMHRAMFSEVEEDNPNHAADGTSENTMEGAGGNRQEENRVGAATVTTGV